MAHRKKKISAQLVEDEEYRLRYERVAGIDVAKAGAVVCTRLPAAREGGRRRVADGGGRRDGGGGRGAGRAAAGRRGGAPCPRMARDSLGQQEASRTPRSGARPRAERARDTPRGGVFLLLSPGRVKLRCMPASAASLSARDAIDEFLQHLADRGLSASTRRIRKTYLNEYLRHARQAAGTTAPALTAGDLMDGERAQAWLADAAAGKTRIRNTIRGPEAAAYPNSMRVRADTLNAFAEFLGEPARVDRQPPARGYHLTPGDTEKLLHELTVKRPIHANAITALRTAAVASLVADTGRGVPELAGLKVSALHLDGDEPTVEADGETFPLTGTTVHILTRWLAARAAIIADLEGSDPGHLWIPTKPGRARGGVPSAKPGISPAAVRTLHASHRALVSQLLGTPLRPGALRAAAAAALPDPASTGE
jgi:integrase